MAYNPQTIKTYYRLTKPGIIYGNLITAVAGYLFASHLHIGLKSFVGLVLGLSMVVACGCVTNNVIDKDIDSKMERTKTRALVTGLITTKKSLIYAAILGSLGLVLLVIMANVLTFIIGLIGLVFYVVIYGLAKRRTVYSTLIGAISGAIPPLGGYVAYKDSVDLAGILLFVILICWQVAHFYAISLYRKKDYQTAKLPVWSVVKGEASTQIQIVAFIGLFIVFSVSLFILGYTGYIYLLIDLIIGIGWLWSALTNIDTLSSAKWGKLVFKNSLLVILLWSLSISLGPVLP